MPGTPFTSSRRWLRGRIIDRLRDAEPGTWVTIQGPIGNHDGAAVIAALEDLSREGLAEVDVADSRRARLPSG